MKNTAEEGKKNKNCKMPITELTYIVNMQICFISYRLLSSIQGATLENWAAEGLEEIQVFEIKKNGSLHGKFEEEARADTTEWFFTMIFLTCRT